MHTVIKQTRTLILFLGLAGSLPVFVPGFVPAAHAAADAAVKPDLKKVGQHLRDHQKYPATRADLLASCNGLVDFSAGEKRWYAEHLPEGTYKSAADVLKAISRK